jgi:hypothetical protein
MDNELNDEELDNLVETFWHISQITDDIQRDISIAKTLDKDHREKLSKWLKLSEEEMQKKLDNAVHEILDVMPLATMNRCNMITMIIARHANVTGDPLIHKIFERINERALNSI